jgi:3',5'-cyclic AMP phosphodiesterase CpdA
MVKHTRIIHLSDLHFGAENYKACWQVVEQYLQFLEPDLLLVTGDIADYPSRVIFEEAKHALDSLRVSYFVCAGNHDRHLKGNVASSLILKVIGKQDAAANFADVFQNHVATPSEFRVADVGNHSRLKIGVLGLESSQFADY